jgi:hypothetical protein
MVPVSSVLSPIPFPSLLSSHTPPLPFFCGAAVWGGLPVRQSASQLLCLCSVPLSFPALSLSLCLSPSLSSLSLSLLCACAVRVVCGLPTLFESVVCTGVESRKTAPLSLALSLSPIAVGRGRALGRRRQRCLSVSLLCRCLRTGVVRAACRWGGGSPVLRSQRTLSQPNTAGVCVVVGCRLSSLAPQQLPRSFSSPQQPLFDPPVPLSSFELSSMVAFVGNGGEHKQTARDRANQCNCAITLQQTFFA